MRRTGPSVEGSVESGAPSKATSESEAGESTNDGERGGSSADGTPVKDRMILSREEKEVKYQKARERIFRDFPETSASDSASVDGGLSRSSSASGRKKASRQRTPHDDGFEVRSQYNMYYPGMHHYSSGPVHYGVTTTNDGSFSAQSPFMVGPNAATYVQNTPSNVMYPGPMGMNAVPQYPMALSHQMEPGPAWQGPGLPQQSPFAGYATMSQPAPMIGQPAAQRSPVLNTYAIPSAPSYQTMTPNWAPPPPPPHYKAGFQQSPYRTQPPPPPPAAAVHCYPPQPMTPPGPTSYAYGQFPGQPMKPGMQSYSTGSLHAGNYNRSLFNPQTRSFVPGSRYPPRGNQHGMNPYFGAQGGMQQQFVDSGRNYEMAGYHTPDRSGGNKDSIAKWGTPSHLPPKPPPSEVPSDFGMRHRGATMHPYGGNPLSDSGPLIVSGEASKPN